MLALLPTSGDGKEGQQRAQSVESAYYLLSRRLKCGGHFTTNKIRTYNRTRVGGRAGGRGGAEEKNPSVEKVPALQKWPVCDHFFPL